MSKNKNIRQATQIWSVLDNLSKSDPVAYRAYIKEQIEQGQKMTSPPKPDLLIRISTRNARFSSIYVLICSWSRLPAPKNDDEPLNVIGGEPYEVTDDKNIKTSETLLYPLAFSDDIVTKYGSNSDNNKAQLELIDMCLDFLKKEKKLNIDTNSMYELCSEKYVGTIENLYKAFNYTAFDPETEFKETFGDLVANKEISLTKSDDELEEELTELKITNEKPLTTPLIEEIEVPTVSVDQQRRCLTIAVPLPSIKSLSEVELDVAETAVHLEIPSHKSFKPVHVTLPRQILIASAEAKFNRKQSKLFIVAKLK